MFPSSPLCIKKRWCVVWACGRQVRAFASSFAAQQPRLDVLINNAAVMTVRLPNWRAVGVRLVVKCDMTMTQWRSKHCAPSASSVWSDLT